MPNTVKGVEIDPVREKLIELFTRYFDIGDSYAYNLTRVKSAFACGTMGFDDFEEFDEETVADIVNYLIANGVTVIDNNVGCKTKADYIRDMNDEELAEYMAKTQIANVAEALKITHIQWEQSPDLQELTAKECLEWLRQPVEENDYDL